MEETLSLSKSLVVDMFSALLATKSILESIYGGEVPDVQVAQSVVDSIQTALDNTPDDVRDKVIDEIVKNLTV